MGLGLIDTFVEIAVKGIFGLLKYIYKFAVWFYGTFLPFVLQYFGIPLFALGVILAFAFAGGTLLFTILLFVFLYYFIKGTIFDSTP